MNETVEETIVETINVSNYVTDDTSNQCIIGHFCIHKFNTPIHVKCYALLHLTSLYGDPLLNRKTVQTFAFSTNTFVSNLLDSLNQSVLAVLPNISEDDKFEVEKVWSVNDIYSMIC